MINENELKKKIGEPFTENGCIYRMVNGRKVGQIDEKTEHDKKLNESINMVRASGLRISDYLKKLYG